MHVTLATFLTLKTNICHEKERVFVSVSPEEEIIQRTIQVFSYNPNTVQVINDFSVMVFLLDLLTLQNVQLDISLSCDCDTPCKVHTIQ